MLLRAFFLTLAVCWSTGAVRAASDPLVKCPSPNGRYALRIVEQDPDNAASYKVDLIEKATGEVVLDLENAYESHLDDTVVVWSADSKRMAYGTRGYKEGDTTVYFWNGSVFEEVLLPDNLPDPQIHFKKGVHGVKNYGGATKPLRWLKSGELELASDSVMLAHNNGDTYTAVVRFTVRFDAQHRASVHKVGKSVTQVD